MQNEKKRRERDQKEQVFTFQSFGAHNLANRKIQSTSFTWRDLLFELLVQMFSSLFSSFYGHIMIFFLLLVVFLCLLLQPISLAFYRLAFSDSLLCSSTNKQTPHCTHTHPAHFFLHLALCLRAHAHTFYIFASFIFGTFNDSTVGKKPVSSRRAKLCGMLPV